MQPFPFHARAILIRRRNVFLFLHALGVVAVVVAALGGFDPLASLALLVPSSALAFGAALAFTRGLSPARRAASIHADELGISIDGRLALPRAELRAAALAPEGEPLVALATRSWRKDVTVRFERNADACAFIAALDLPMSAPAPTFRATSGGVSRLWISIAAAIPLAIAVKLTLGRVVPIAPEIISTLVPLWILGSWLAMSAEIHVGPEGILVKQLGRRPTFLAYAEIASITEQHDDIVFVECDGTKHRLGFADTRWLTGGSRRPTIAVLARIRGACSAFAARASDPSGDAFAPAW